MVERDMAWKKANILNQRHGDLPEPSLRARRLTWVAHGREPRFVVARRPR
jgi:hypothetical protein